MQTNKHHTYTMFYVMITRLPGLMITFIHYSDTLSEDSKFWSDKLENRSDMLMQVRLLIQQFLTVFPPQHPTFAIINPQIPAQNNNQCVASVTSILHIQESAWTFQQFVSSKRYKLVGGVSAMIDRLCFFSLNSWQTWDKLDIKRVAAWAALNVEWNCYKKS